MAQFPYIPGTAPFTREQRAWLNGYLAGLFADANLAESGAVVSPAAWETERTHASGSLGAEKGRRSVER